ncbi:torsin-1A-like [Watersipora subatra]|uniref:torsin-1A-like n=1 Tax=Watersipora subatra TaxID=2589382 RepID=UPI00355C56D0
MAKQMECLIEEGDHREWLTKGRTKQKKMRLQTALLWGAFFSYNLRSANAGLFTAVFESLKDFFGRAATPVEQCREPWIKTELPNLRADLEAKVYGQHLVIDSVVKTVRVHLRRSPQKALALSFQGWTGTGKNLVASIIAQNLYDRGMRSEYVHVLTAYKHFKQHEEEWVVYYKDQIQQWVEGNVSSCPRQLFIFDEVEDMPDGLLDALKPFLDHYESVQGTDYRSSIFLFLGNLGGKVLYKAAHNHHQSGGKRNDLEVKDMEKMLRTKAYNSKGGLKVSRLINSNLISHYIPFLPLEKRHVQQCANDELMKRDVEFKKRDGLIEKVISQLTFTPEDVELYSTSGCKRVSEMFDLIMEEGYYEPREKGNYDKSEL